MCSIQAPHCWMTFATLTLKLSMTLSKTSFGILLISLLTFFSVSQLCLDCPHTLSPLGSPIGNSPGELDPGSNVAMDCRSFSKLNGLLEGIGGGYWTMRSEQWGGAPSYWKTTVSKSNVPEWSVYEACRCIGLRSLSLDDHHHFQRSMRPKYHSFQVHTIPSFFLHLAAFHCVHGLLSSPKPKVLPINVATQMEVPFITEEETVQKLRLILYTLTYFLAKLITFSLVGLSLRLENLHFVGK